MTIKPGDKFPSNVSFSYVPYSASQDSLLSCGIPRQLQMDKFLPGKKIVLVSVPGAFTPTCTANHIPPYVEKLAELTAKDVDTVLVISANDAFVLNAWGKALNALQKEKFIFASDPDGRFSSQLGPEFVVDNSARGMGIRTARYALIVDNGVVTYVGREPAREVTVSGADAVLSKL